MFLYLCRRVLDEGAEGIHEQEVGHNVFGRPVDYDTVADNIVRVHASMLRKRIHQYFATEGRWEPVIIDVPKGNYAPVFRKRPAGFPPAADAPATADNGDTPVPPQHAKTAHDGEPGFAAPGIPPRATRWDLRMWLPSAMAVLFACGTVFFAVRAHHNRASSPLFANQPVVRQFWSQVFQAGSLTDIVLDDASLGFFQELTNQDVSLSQYFDRSYLRSVEDSAAAAKLDPEFARTLVLKRQSSYADVSLFWKLNQIAGSLQANTRTHFARDYSFRELKTNNTVLLGNSRSNPWIEPFETHLALRWKFDKSQGTYYPVDDTAPAADQQKFHVAADTGKPREGYASIAFLPNLSGTGKVLIISGTGGSAVSAALSFLSDESSIAQLRSRLPQGKSSSLPYFEALLKTESRSTMPRDTAIVLCRSVQP
jgi:hypothetical protein